MVTDVVPTVEYPGNVIKYSKMAASVSDGSKIMKWGSNEPPTFKNGPGDIIAAIIFELQITVMIYLDFQRSIVPHNVHVCAAFFKTVRECRCSSFRYLPDKKATVGYSIPDEIPTTCFQLCELV